MGADLSVRVQVPLMTQLSSSPPVMRFKPVAPALLQTLTLSSGSWYVLSCPFIFVSILGENPKCGTTVIANASGFSQ